MTWPAEVVLRSDVLEVVLFPGLGGRIHRLRAFGTDLIRTPEDPIRHVDDPFFWGAYPMAPWCNRVRPGPIRAGGQIVDLPANFVDGSAIHGHVATRPWQLAADGSLRVEVGGDADGWPWPYEVTATAAVDGPVLTLDYRLVNGSDEPMPGGIGLHPWFLRPVILRVPAERVYPANTGSAPEPEPVAGALDLRIDRAPADDLDGTWTALAAPRIELTWPTMGIAAGIDVEATRVLVAVATPAHLDAVAVEPQTHGPDGLRRLVNGEGDPLTIVDPGDALRLGLRFTFERTRAER